MSSPSPIGGIHPTAIIDSGAKVPKSCRVGPYCTIGPEVELGEHCELISHVVLGGPAKIGSHNRIFPFASVGLEPQDMKFKGEKTRLEIGDHNLVPLRSRGVKHQQREAAIAGDEAEFFFFIRGGHADSVNESLFTTETLRH